MAEESDANPLAKLPLPSIYALAYMGFIYFTFRDLSVNQYVVEWLDNGAKISEFPLQAFSGGIILVTFAGVQLAKFAGVGKKEYYDELEDLDVNSLSQQAGAWAQAGEVPTRSPDGKYEVATFAGGCFCEWHHRIQARVCVHSPP